MPLLYSLSLMDGSEVTYAFIIFPVSDGCQLTFSSGSSAETRLFTLDVLTLLILLVLSNVVYLG